jgi:hypothetical protein
VELEDEYDRNEQTQYTMIPFTYAPFLSSNLALIVTCVGARISWPQERWPIFQMANTAASRYREFHCSRAQPIYKRLWFSVRFCMHWASFSTWGRGFGFQWLCWGWAGMLAGLCTNQILAILVGNLSGAPDNKNTVFYYVYIAVKTLPFTLFDYLKRNAFL